MLATSFLAVCFPNMKHSYVNCVIIHLMTSILYAVIPVTFALVKLKYTGKSTHLQLGGHYILSKNRKKRNLFKEVHQDMSLRKKEMNMKRHLLIIIKKNIKKNNQRF